MHPDSTSGPGGFPGEEQKIYNTRKLFQRLGKEREHPNYVMKRVVM